MLADAARQQVVWCVRGASMPLSFLRQQHLLSAQLDAHDISIPISPFFGASKDSDDSRLKLDFSGYLAM